MAMLVVPLAGVTVAKGFKRHRRRWVVATITGLLVMILIMRVSVQNVQNVLITRISQT